VTELADRWRRGDKLILNNILACDKGLVAGRVVWRRKGHKPVLIGKGSTTLDFNSPGRVAVKIKLTERGRKLKKDGRRMRVKVTIRVVDPVGASLTYTKKATLRSDDSQ